MDISGSNTGEKIVKSWSGYGSCQHNNDDNDDDNYLHKIITYTANSIKRMLISLLLLLKIILKRSA